MSELHPEDLTILFIEDDQDYALLVHHLLKSLLETKVCLKLVPLLEEGLKLLAAHDWDLVLLDLNLPDGTGVDTLKKLRRFDSEVPVVVLSGLPDENLAFKVLEAGAQDFLPKDKLDRTALWRSLTLAAGRRQFQARLEHQVKQRTGQLNQALSQLESNRSFLRTVFDSMPHFIVVLKAQDDEFLLEDFNQYALKASGGAVADLKGQKLNPFFSARPDLLADLRRCLADKISISRETYYRAVTSGRDYFVTVTFSFLAPGKVLVIAQDLTGRRKTEEAAQHLASIVESSEEAIISAGLDGNITSWNRGAARVFGYEASEVLGRHVRVLIPQEAMGEASRIEQLLKEGEAVRRLETQRLRKDGSKVDVSLSMTRLEDMAGQPVGYSYIAQDITSQQAAKRELTRMEQFQRGILEGINTGVWVSDQDDCISYFNRAMEEMSGLSRDGAMGLNVLAGFSAETLRHMRPLYLKAKETANPVPYEAIPLITPEGRKTFQSGWLIPLMHQGSFAGMICTVDDVTARQKNEQELLAYQERLRTLASELTLAEERQRRRIAANLHDGLGQLLAMCKLQLKMMARPGPQSGQSMQTALDLLEQAIGQARSLTADLSPPALYELGLGPALEQLAERHHDLYGVPVRFSHNSSGVLLSPETSAFLYRAASELLHNTAKHAEAELVEISLERLQSSVFLVLKDNGVGFDYSESAGEGQQGLGLFSIRERIQALGGALVMDSQPGRGTWATLVVPAEPEAAGGQA